MYDLDEARANLAEAEKNAELASELANTAEERIAVAALAGAVTTARSMIAICERLDVVIAILLDRRKDGGE